MNRYQLLYLAVLLLSCLQIRAQQYNFRNYSVKEGVAQSQVYTLLQDSRGYLWMGTRGGGITSFDGVNFKTLTQKDGLVNNYVFCIREDADHVLWIGTNNGLSRYNGLRFDNYTISDTSRLQVLDIAFDSRGRQWLATNYGVLLFDKGIFTNVTLKMQMRISLINTLAIDKNGNIWYGDAFGLGCITDANGTYSLKLFNRNTGFTNTSVNALRFHSDGSLWIGTYHDGLYVYRNGQFGRIYSDPVFDMQSIFDICFDRNNNAWLATLERGVCQYSLQSGSLGWLTEAEGLSNNHVRSVIQDKSGNYWFGTSGGGVCNYFGKQFTVYDRNAGLGGNFIYSIFRDSKQRLFIGTSDKGLTVLDSNRFKQYNASNGFQNVKVKAIVEDNMHTIYLGTDGDGLYTYNDTAFAPVQAMANKYIRAIVKDNAGNLYIATAGSGIYKLTRVNNTVEFISFTKNQGLLSNRVNCLHYDKRGQLWYGTENHGVGVIVNDKVSEMVFSSRNGLPSDAVRCFTEDKKGRLWIGTAGNGIASMFLYQNDYRMTIYNDKSGLTSSNIYLLTSDAMNRIFAGSETGLDCISTDATGKIESIRHYSKGEGFTGIETCQNAVFNDANGVIWFGTINGLTRYMPADKFRNENEPVTSITDVRLFYESLSKTAYKSYVGDWNSIRPLVLPHNRNHLSFDFLGINFSNPEAVRYSWKLEGFDEEWSPVSAQRTVTYSNLPYGEYTFFVKACNEDGVWNIQPKAFRFTITPPFWMQWWVIALAALAVILVVWLIFRWRVKRIRRKAAEQQQKIRMEKELLELEQKALRLQMNPHFIFNALNSIQSQIGTDNEQAARYYLAKFSRLMRQILDNSRNTVIPLQEEISTLENYLLIEKFCNGDRFDYAIHVDGNIETDEVKVPPMLLQPFIENAIKHGLRYTDDKRGMITVDIRLNGPILECSVTDNGIGRKKAAELNKNSKETYHKSTALLVTQERLDLIQKDDHSGSLEIIDLYDDRGEAAGTRVLISIPLTD